MYRCAFGGAPNQDADENEYESVVRRMLASENDAVGKVHRELRIPFPSKIPRSMASAIESAKDRIVELRQGLPETLPPYDTAWSAWSAEDNSTYAVEREKFIVAWMDVMHIIETRGRKRRALE